MRAAAATERPGTEIHSRGDLDAWLEAHAAEREPTGIHATFTVSLDGSMRLASRRSEHVACAAGEPVLSAGEISFDVGPNRVTAISNLSTGYCPERESWAAVAEALDRAGVPHPGRFTDAFVFRRCPACGERNLVKDDDYSCALCGADLPTRWNFA